MGKVAAACVLASLAFAPSVQADHRESCEAIRGTAYEHPSERPWFWTHCVWDIYGGGVSSGALVSTPSPALPDPAAQFAAGYTAAGGPAYYLNHILANVIPCESTWDVHAVNPAGPFYGLMQFWPTTWYAVGGGDWYDPYTQGRNTARLIAMADPAGSWPYCWFAGGY